MGPLSEEEIREVRRLLEVAQLVREEAEYRAAVRLVLSTWKRVVIAAAAVIGAFILLREQIRTLWQWMIA